MLPKLFLKNNAPPSISTSVCVQIEKTRRPVAHLRLSHISWISGASSLWNTRWKEISSRGITCICKKQLLLALRPVYQGFIFLHFFFSPLRGLWHLLCLCGIVLFLPEISSVTLLCPPNLSVESQFPHHYGNKANLVRCQSLCLPSSLKTKSFPAWASSRSQTFAQQ